MNALEYYTIEQIQAGNDRLQALAEHLETADEEHARKGEMPYDQTTTRHYESRTGVTFPIDDPRRTCGTPACAMGHAAFLFKTDKAWTESGAMDFFAIGEPEDDELFAGNGCNNAKSSREASGYIKAFVTRRRLELSQLPQEEGEPLDSVGP